MKQNKYIKNMLILLFINIQKVLKYTFKNIQNNLKNKKED